MLIRQRGLLLAGAHGPQCARGAPGMFYAPKPGARRRHRVSGVPETLQWSVSAANGRSPSLLGRLLATGNRQCILCAARQALLGHPTHKGPVRARRAQGQRLPAPRAGALVGLGMSLVLSAGLVRYSAFEKTLIKLPHIGQCMLEMPLCVQVWQLKVFCARGYC